MISDKYPDDTPVLVVILDRGDVLYLWDTKEANEAWHQLKKDVKWTRRTDEGVEEGSYKIKDMYLRFRSHTYGWLDKLPSEDRERIQGFFFRKGKGGLILEKQVSGQWEQYVVGHVLDDKIYVTTLMVPHLHPLHSDVYELTKDNAQDVIFNGPQRQDSVPRRQNDKKASKKQRNRASR